MNDPECNMLAVHASEYPEGIPRAAWDASMGVNNRPTQTIGGRAVHRHTFAHATSELAADAAEPADVLLAHPLAVAEHPRCFLAALSCLSLLSAVMGAVFLRQRARGDEELPSHF